MKRLVPAADTQRPLEVENSRMASKQYWVRAGNGRKVQGPFSSAQLKQLAIEGKLRPDHLLSDDRERWFEAGRVKDLNFKTTANETATTAGAADTSPEPASETPEPSEAAVKKLLAGTGTLPTLQEGLREAPRPIAIACGIWLGFGALTAVNAIAAVFVCICIGVAAHKALVNESFNLAMLGFGIAIGAGVSLVIAGSLFDASRNAMQAKKKSLKGSALLSIAVGGLGAACLAGLLAIAAFNAVAGESDGGRRAQSGMLRSAKIPAELASFVRSSSVFTLIVVPPALIWAGLLIRRHGEKYDAWRAERWESIPEDAPERITTEDQEAQRQSEQQKQTVEMLSRFLPLDRIPEERRWMATQLIIGGAAIVILLVLAGMVYWVQATTKLD